MSKTVDFIFDFASPNGYFCHKVIPDIEARTGAKFVYKPCLLGGIHKLSNNQAPMVAFADIPLKMEYDSIEIDRFIKKHAIDEFKMNPNFPIITLQLMRAAVAADMDGYLMEFIEAMLPCMWEKELKMDDPEVLKAAFSDAGFDADKIFEQMASDEVKAKLISNTQEAVDRGAFGIPTFFVGDEIFFGKERLGQIEELLQA